MGKLPIFEILYKILFKNYTFGKFFCVYFCLCDKCVILWQNNGILFLVRMSCPLRWYMINGFFALNSDKIDIFFSPKLNSLGFQSLE